MTDWLTILPGDCREVLATLPAESVNCVVTSPPYWGLRDYGHGDQLGLEPTPEEYVANLVAVFREVRRVLTKDGTVWLNLGDSYAGSSQTGGTDPAGLLGYGNSGTRDVRATFAPRRGLGGVKPKDLVGIPWRVAFALQADGWWLRSDIIWSKPNPMPESVTDRPTRSHEYVFLLTKSARYFFDAEAVREPSLHIRERGRPNGLDNVTNKMAPLGRDNSAGANGARNIRTVWTIATQPYPGAHFATFPEALVEPCIKAGTSERGVCPVCGAAWVRVMMTHRPQELDDSTRNRDKALARKGMAAVPEKGWESSRETTGWAATCDHDAEPVPATVLDPFGGSGTTARVANRLSRRAVLIELNPDYIEQAEARNAQAPLGLGA